MERLWWMFVLGTWRERKGGGWSCSRKRLVCRWTARRSSGGMCLSLRLPPSFVMMMIGQRHDWLCPVWSCWFPGVEVGWAQGDGRGGWTKKKTLHNNRLWNLSSQTARFFRWMFWFEAISASCGRVWVISRGRVFRMNIEYSSPLAHHQQWTPSHVVRLGYLSNYEHIALNVFSMILWWRELCLR